MLSAPPKLTASDVKDALRARHPGGGGQFPGAWTCIEEWAGIDLLAWSAWGSDGAYGRVGYEVKVSRSDLRRELLRPQKRAQAVSWCNEFYFAVPAGLLKPEELAYEEPVWDDVDFVRVPCPRSLTRADYRSSGYDRDMWKRRCNNGEILEPFIGPLNQRTFLSRTTVDPRHDVSVPCPACGGVGYASKSRVELEAPYAWVPADVGLVVVHPSGCRVVRKSPRRKDVPALGVREAGQLVRWISMRPDPRHARVGPPD